MAWDELAEWWSKEVGEDRTYEELVTPLLLEVFRPESDALYLDLGCGEGRVMRTILGLGAQTVGFEVALPLAESASKVAPTVVGRLPGLSAFRPDSFGGAYCVLVLEHIEDVPAFFAAVGSVVRPGGTFSLVINHPIWTAPGSTPVTDDTDGEVFWRSGDYFGSGHTDERAGSSTIRFHHRSMADLVNAAADSGWSLEMMIERPHHEMIDQAGIPRLLACRWRLVP